MESSSVWIILPKDNNTGDVWLTFKKKGETSSAAASTILVFLLVTTCVKLIYKSNKKLYKPIPGPIPLPLLGNALMLSEGPEKLISTISELLDNYKGIFRLWLGPKLYIFISRPSDLEVFCTHPKLQNKSEQYRFVTPILGDGIFASNGNTWKNGRRLIMPTLRPLVLKLLTPKFDKHAKVLIDVLEKEVDGNPFDAYPFIRNCAYDMIFETVLGRQINSQVVPLQALLDTEEAMDMIYQRVFKVWLQWDPLYKILPVGQRFYKLCEKLNRFNLEEIFKSLESGNSSDSQLLVRLLAEKLGDEQDLIRMHIVTMLITGYDTTTGTMGFILLMLGIHQDVQARAYEEIIAVKAKLNGRDFEADDLNELIYLDCVIKETLRLYPVGPLLFREATEDVQFGEYIVPKGATVACVMYHTHRNPDIFPDPHLFNPENFLPKKAACRHTYSFIPFSSGPRGCIGVKYAMLSMKVMISNLLYNYHIHCDMKMSDICLKPEITLKSKGGYPIRIKRRVR